MSDEVFANSREISGKATSNKSIAAMADVCLSPPSPPVGPIPIPYPNFSEASDTSGGSKTVKIRGQEAGLKDESNYKCSKGDEAATKSLGMGLVTHNISGATEHTSWSMDVKIEKKNVLRLLDMTSHNHGSPPFNLALTTDVAKFEPANPDDDKCDSMNLRNEAAREEGPPEGRTNPTTHSAGHYTAPDGQEYNMIACSKEVDFVNCPAYSDGVGKSSTETYSRTYNRGTPDEETRAYPAENASNLCGDYQHKSRNNCSKSAHTEARMIEQIFKNIQPSVTGLPGQSSGALGTLRMRIRWDTGDEVRDYPCSDCKKLICAAEDCGLRIELCKDGNPDAEPGCPPQN